MDSNDKLQKGLDESLRMTCVDMATNVVGKVTFRNEKGDLESINEDVISVAERMYKYIKGE